MNTIVGPVAYSNLKVQDTSLQSEGFSHVLSRLTLPEVQEAQERAGKVSEHERKKRMQKIIAVFLKLIYDLYELLTLTIACDTIKDNIPMTSSLILGG